MSSAARTQVDVVVVGAGFAGVYALHKLRSQGLAVRVFESAPSVGGTWYYNRYPGARCDVESVDYCYSFSDELQQEWTWTEKYATQGEILRYINWVVDKLDLRTAITFGTRVTGVVLDEANLRWTVTTDTGERVEARFVVMATGPLSAALTPQFPGLDSFAGAVFHTAHWPEEPVDFTGKRVAVIGTGSSGIQCIPIIAEQAEQLYVFQRTPNYSVPAGNRPLSAGEISEIKASYPERRRKSWRSGGGSPPVPIWPVRFRKSVGWTTPFWTTRMRPPCWTTNCSCPTRPKRLAGATTRRTRRATPSANACMPGTCCSR